jgi:hypothetical protein
MNSLLLTFQRLSLILEIKQNFLDASRTYTRSKR